MNNIQETGDQYLDDLIYLGETARAFGLDEVLSITIDEYKKRKEELDAQNPPWLN